MHSRSRHTAQTNTAGRIALFVDTRFWILLPSKCYLDTPLRGKAMVLVTGPTGFVGRRVVAALNAGGHPVRALVHGENPASVLSGLDVEIVRGDLLDVESLRKACDGIDGVIHLVAVVRERGDLTYRRVNYEGTRNVLEAASSSGAKRFIQASTVGATSDPGLPLPALTLDGRGRGRSEPYLTQGRSVLRWFRRR